METGVYIGLTTGRSILPDIENITGMFKPGSFDKSYTWALTDNHMGANKIPPHITLLNRIKVCNAVTIEDVENSITQVGKAVEIGTVFKLTPTIDPYSLELIAKPNPYSLERRILDEMADLLVEQLAVKRHTQSLPHLRIARLNSGDGRDFKRINGALTAFPIHFVPSLLYANLVDEKYIRFKTIFSILNYHQSQK